MQKKKLLNNYDVFEENEWENFILYKNSQLVLNSTLISFIDLIVNFERDQIYISLNTSNKNSSINNEKKNLRFLKIHLENIDYKNISSEQIIFFEVKNNSLNILR